MPRRRQRFSNLEAEFRSVGGIAAPGSRLDKYIQFKTGKTKVDRRKATLTAAQRTRFGVSLLPFNIDAPETVTQDARYESSITAYSNTGRTELGLSDAELGYGGVTIEGKTAKSDPSYYPALLRPAIRGAVEDKTATSSITGTQYYYKEHRLLGIPFGRTTATAKADSEEDRRTVLARAAKAGATKAASVGYDPEVWRGKKTPLPELPGT